MPPVTRPSTRYGPWQKHQASSSMTHEKRKPCSAAARVLSGIALLLTILEVFLVLPSGPNQGDFAEIGEAVVFAGASLLYIIRSCLVVPLALNATRSGSCPVALRSALVLTYLTPMYVIFLHALFDAQQGAASRVVDGYLSGPMLFIDIFR